MSRLTELLGQPAVAANLVARLAVPSARVWLQGPSGSGKTTISDMVIAGSRQLRPTIRICGDAGYSDTKYLALYRALEGTRKPRAVRDAIRASVTAPLRAIPFVGATAAEFAKIAVAAQSEVHPEFLSSEQQDLLQGLQAVAGDRSLLIVVDDIGWLDADTAQLIFNFSLPEIQVAYPFTETASILFVENIEAKATLDHSMIQRLRTPDPTVVARVSRETFPMILEAFGLQVPIDTTTVDAVYSIARGHLEIARQIVETLNCHTSENAFDEADTISLMSGLLTKRLANSEHAEDVQRLICIAACLGTAFSEAEVRCAYRDEQTFPTALNVALREHLFQSAGPFIQFAHDVIRVAAERLGSVESQRVHGKLTECIKLLRPGDYASRLKHSRLAGNLEQTRELAFAISMQAVRGERVLPLPLEEVDTHRNVLGDASTAYRLMDAGEHRQALSLMMPHYTGELSLIQGEVVALIALNQIKTRTPDAYSAAANLLEHWQDRREEPEIWQRLMSALITAWTACGDTEKATQLYTRLAEDLMRRSNGDPTARTRVEALNRKADQFFTTEIAVKHIQRAVAWFSPTEGSFTPRHAFEYTASLVNLSAAQFTLGQFAAAENTASMALRWIDELHQRGFRTTEPYKALNNYVIAAFRASTETAGAACEALTVLLSNSETGWRLDRSLVAINQAALMLIAGPVEPARDLLEAVLDHITSEDIDGYYALYAASNLAVALALTGKRQRAKRLLEDAEPYLETIPKWHRNAHRRRLALMIQAIGDKSVNSAVAFDNFPTRHRAPDGDQDAWWSIGRGLLMSDIQVWSEG